MTINKVESTTRDLVRCQWKGLTLIFFELICAWLALHHLFLSIYNVYIKHDTNSSESRLCALDNSVSIDHCSF